jgi:hypothetical protein
MQAGVGNPVNKPKNQNKCERELRPGGLIDRHLFREAPHPAPGRGRLGWGSPKGFPVFPRGNWIKTGVPISGSAPMPMGWGESKRRG